MMRARTLLARLSALAMTAASTAIVVTPFYDAFKVVPESRSVKQAYPLVPGIATYK